MKKVIVFILLISSCSFLAFSQEVEDLNKPKLVVGIVVDQMRYDYLEKFSPYFSGNGFKKLQKEGFSYTNMNYNYKPSYTGPGHASIFTGATPSIHGIVGNNWYSRTEGNSVYCVKVPTDSGFVLSPDRLLSESVGDVVKSTFNGQVYAVALKDRGAILPAGHAADGAYWFNSKTGEWESSSFYPNQFPSFLKQFNSQNFKSEAIAENWVLNEELVGKEIKWLENSQTVQLQNFEYDLSSMFNDRNWDLLKSIPYGNQMTADFAKNLIKAENLGIDSTLDFLSVSFSATDYVGHIYGVESSEIADTYVKLDSTLASFIDFLDHQIGKSNYVLFLSSDHGADLSRKFLAGNNVASGRLKLDEMEHHLDAYLDSNFSEEDWIISLQNLNFYFNHDVKKKYSSKIDTVIDAATFYLLNDEGVASVINPLRSESGSSDKESMVLNGFLKQRSGDLILVESKHWTSYSEEGSTHGSAYSYDTHVPFILYGAGVSSGNSNKQYKIVDIAPTICNTIGVKAPSGSVGKVITEHKK
ncbi:MAG: alkaline phosphatase family protein [Vicingaceae bacterium]